jgi:hypothetical protein
MRKRKVIIGCILIICMLLIVPAVPAINTTSLKSKSTTTITDQQNAIQNEKTKYFPGKFLLYALCKLLVIRYMSFLHRSEFWNSRSGEYFGGYTHPLLGKLSEIALIRSDFNEALLGIFASLYFRLNS